MRTSALLRSRPWALAALAVAIAAQLVWFALVVQGGGASIDSLTRPTLFTVVMAILLVTRGRSSVPVLLARLTVAGAFLNALWHRFDDFGRFINYAGQVNSFLPSAVIPFLAVVATVLEVVFCAALIIGAATRWAALGSAILLCLFATAMTLSRLDQFEWAVYVLSTGAWVAAASDAKYILSLTQSSAARGRA